jgi:putative endonuclease
VVTGRQRLGAFAERVARRFLEAQGYEFLEANVRLRSGELDLVMRDGEEIVAVEVRARRDAEGAAAASVDRRKLQRLWRCAIAYAERRGVPLERMRVELVAVELSARGHVERVEHFTCVEIPDEDPGAW